MGPKEIAYGYYDGDTVEVCIGMDILDIAIYAYSLYCGALTV